MYFILMGNIYFFVFHFLNPSITLLQFIVFSDFMTVIQFSRDQFLSACPYIRPFFVLYVLTWHQVKNMGMSRKEMLMCVRYIGELIFICILILGFPEASMIMSKFMSYYWRTLNWSLSLSLLCLDKDFFFCFCFCFFVDLVVSFFSNHDG